MAKERQWHWMDPIIEIYKKDVDITMIRENLKLTPDQRMRKLQEMGRVFDEMQRARKERLKQSND